MKTSRTSKASKKGAKKGAKTRPQGSDQKPSTKDAVQALKALQSQLEAVVADKEDKNGQLTAAQLKKAQAALDETEDAINSLRCIQSHSPY